MNTEQKKLIQSKTTYNYQDLIQDIYSSFKTLKSDNKTFGTSTRKMQEKVYCNKELARTQFWGKGTPGPSYDIRGTEDITTYEQDPRTKIGTAVRKMQPDPKYDYYLRKDYDYQPDQADNLRRPRSATTRIGTESRFQTEKNKNPGPKYKPPLKPEIPSTSRYTLGYKRTVEGQDPLKCAVSTTTIVGPGRYIEGQVPKTSRIEEQPHYSIGKGPKIGKLFTGYDKNQTYDSNSRSIGGQVNSKKKSQPSFSFGRAKRSQTTGMFQQNMMTQPTKININHPRI